MMPSLALSIRAAREADWVGLRAILQDTFESTWLPRMTPAAARAFREQDRAATYVATRGTALWVAEHGCQLVGFVDWDADFANALHVRASYAR